MALLVFRMELLFVLTFLRVFGDRSIAFAVCSIEIHFDGIRRRARTRNKLKKHWITIDSEHYVRLVLMYASNSPYVLSNWLIGYRIPSLHECYTILTFLNSQWNCNDNNQTLNGFSFRLQIFYKFRLYEPQLKRLRC